MPVVSGNNSLFFASGMDNSQLDAGANQGVGIIQNMAARIGKINPFVAIGAAALAVFTKISNDAYKMVRDFEHAMKEVETISEATQRDFAGISNKVFDISKVSPDKPKQLAKAYYQIVSAGYDGAAGLQLLETASKAATGGVTDTMTAADGLTTVLNAWGKDISEVTNVADIFFTTVKLGKTTFPELAQNIAQVAPLASAMGISFEEISAAIATLTKQGTTTPMALTQIRSSLLNMNEVLGDGWSKTMTYQEGLKKIRDMAGGSQNKLKEMLGRVEAVNAVLSMTGEKAKAAADDYKAMGEAAGASEDATNRMLKDNVNQWALAWNKIKAKTKGIGEFWNDLSTGMAKGLNKLLDDSKSLTEVAIEQASYFNILKNTLYSSNTPFEKKLEILKELKESYPGYLKSIDLDKIKHDNLKQTLDGVKNAMEDIQNMHIDNTVLSEYYQKVEKERSKLNALKDDLKDAENSFQNTVSKADVLAKEYGITIKYENIADPVLTSRDIFSQLYQKHPELFDTRRGGKIAKDLHNQLEEISSLKVEIKNQLDDYNSVLDDYEKRRIELEDDEIGYKKYASEIENIFSVEQLDKKFGKFTNELFVNAIKEQKQLINDLNSIKEITEEDFKSGKLDTYLKSSNEKIKEAAEQRRDFFLARKNTTITDETKLQDAIATLEEKGLKLKTDVENAKLAATKDSIEKRKKEAKTEYEQQLRQIEQDRKNYLSAYNEQLPKDKRISSFDQLPKNIVDQFNDLEKYAKQVYANKIISIEKDGANAIDQILKRSAKVFMSENELKIQAINERYALEKQQLIENGATKDQLDKHELARQAEIDLVNQQTAIKLSEYYQKAFGDLSKYGAQTIRNLQDQTKDVIDSAKTETNGGQTYVLVDIPTLNNEGKAIKKTVRLTIEEFNRFKQKYNDLKQISEKNNPFKAVATSFKELLDAFKSGDKDEISDKLISFNTAADDGLDVLNQWGESLGQIFGDEVGQDIQDTINVIGGFKDVGVGIARIYSGDVVGGITQALSGLGSLFSGAKKYHEAERQWKNELLELERELNAVLNEQIRLRQAANASVFINDFVNTITQAHLALVDAKDRYDEFIEGFDYFNQYRSGSSYLVWDAITGKLKQIKDLERILTDLEVKIGLEEKKILGITTGSEDIYGSLLENFPDLINESGRLNVDLAELFLQMESLPERTRQALEDLIQIEEDYQAALEQILETISDVAGSFGDDLRNNLVEAFEEGTSAAEAFEKSVTSALENIMEQMLFNEIFSDAFDALEERMAASFAVGGDMDWSDDLINFFNQYASLSEDYFAAIEAAREAAAEAGLDLWNSSSSSSSGLTAAIKRELTDESVSELAGIIRQDSDELKRNGLKIAESNQHLASITDYSRRTADATEQTVIELQTAVTKLEQIITNTKPAQSSRDLGI